MKSLAIVRATDILKLRSTLLEMNRAGLSFEGKPKEINPVSAEKLLSKIFESRSGNYQICALVSLMQDYEFSLCKVESLPQFSDVLILDSSNEVSKEFAKLIPVLPDLVIPRLFSEKEFKQISDSKEKSSTVYLGIFVNRKIQVETSSGSIHPGVLKHADSIGVLFEPDNDSAPFFITWHDIKKIIIPREETK